MFTYTISKEADNTAFKKVCDKIEAKLQDFEKENLIVDVDGSLTQIYYAANKKIKVLNDYEVDAVYIESEIDLNSLIF